MQFQLFSTLFSKIGSHKAHFPCFDVKEPILHADQLPPFRQRYIIFHKASLNVAQPQDQYGHNIDCSWRLCSFTKIIAKIGEHSIGKDVII